MSCKFLERDLSVIVRCGFTSNRVCKQWVNGANLMNDTDPYSFCERQTNSFTPAPVGDSETNESEVA